MIRAALLFLLVALTGARASGDLPAPSGFISFLIVKGDTNAAALEYERLRTQNPGQAAAIGCALGELYLWSNPARAEGYYEEASESVPPLDSLTRTRCVAGLVTAYLMQRKTALARNELLESDGEDSIVPASTRAFLACAIDASRYEVDSARRYLPSLLPDPGYARQARQIDTLLSWYRSQEIRHPLYTYVYATAVPGWGHWYNNDKKGAVSAFGLMAALTGILGYEAYQFYRGDTRQRYVHGMDFAVIGGLLWRRYHGSIRKAAYNQTISRNAHIQIEFQRRLRSILCNR